MSGGINKVILIGNLTRDPETRSMQDGGSVANISVATSERWTDKASGEKREKAEFHKVVLFGKLAEVAEKYLRKGSKVYLEGQLRTRKWTDRDGVEKYTTEVVLSGYGSEMVMLGDPQTGARGAQESGPGRTETDRGARGAGVEAAVQAQAPLGDSNELDDEIPF